MPDKQPSPSNRMQLPLAPKTPEQQSQILRRAILRQKESRIRTHYAETVGRISAEWQHSTKNCDCAYQEERKHKQVKVKCSDGKWRSICPIRYYILLGWWAITERCAVPSEDLYWQLLNKSKPEREPADE